MRNTLRLLIITAVLFLTLPACADEFAGDLLNNDWRYANLNESYLLSVRAGDRQEANLDSGVKLLREPDSADYTLETCLADPEEASSYNYHTGLVVYLDGDNWLQWGVKHGSQTTFQGVIAGKTLCSKSIKSSYAYIRIQKEGPVYRFQCGADAETWQSLAYEYEDTQGALTGASVGLLSRYLFGEADTGADVDYVEYTYFKENGRVIPLYRAEENGWTLRKSKGDFELLVKEGANGSRMPRLLKEQIAGDWVLQGEITYDSSKRSTDSHTGLALYADEQNWLIWGVRNGVTLELGGMIGGEPTGVLVGTDTIYQSMRIMKRTGDAAYTRYYVYGAVNAYYGWDYLGCYEDRNGVFVGARYGVMGLENSGAAGAGFATQYDYVSDYTLENYKDCFESCALDGMWTQQPNGSPRTTLKDGKLVMELSAGNGNEDMVLVLRRPLRRDWIIETVVSAAGDDVFTGLVLSADGGDALFFGRQGGSARLSGTVAGTAVEETCEAEEEMRLIRIRKEEQIYLFQYSATGAAWITAATFADETGALTDAKYGLMGSLEKTGDEGASFDSFSESVRPYGRIADIDYTEEVAVLTGENSINRTETNWRWGSGDLGSLFESNGTVYMAFGDTFTGVNQTGKWIHNSIARIRDGDFSKGLVFDWMRYGTSGLVLPRAGSEDMSTIPVYGFGAEQNGVETLYLYVMEVRNWGSGGHWDCNGGAWAISTDVGETWELQRALFAGNSNFMQIALWREGDDLYVLGTTGGGFGQVCLAKVSVADILERDAYRFYTGCDETGEPRWSTAEADAVPVIDSVNREIAVTYDAYLGVYLMTTLDNVNQQMVLREAPQLWGPWSSPYVLFDEEYVSHQTTNHCFYGCYMLPRYMENDGETVYMTLNKWEPYELSWVKVHFRREK